MTPVDCVVLGAGGHARVVIEALRSVGQASPVGLISPHAPSGGDVDGVPWRGDDSQLPVLAGQGVTGFCVGVGGTGGNSTRARLFELGISSGLHPLTVVHAAAYVAPTAALGRGVFVAAGAMVAAGAILGANVIVNTGAVVDHDCQIDEHAHIATGASLAGGIRVHALAHIGAGATLKQGVTVGRAAVVGLGAAVIRDVPPGTTVAGVPARPLRS